eukprot:GILJ01003226.1.p1 GENE.GILJ01003226.1~~GILJ01003226.1.p1  ORF type:complete len:444 (+),score=75.07 GILJ01003226.1:40-1332(+)
MTQHTTRAHTRLFRIMNQLEMNETAAGQGLFSHLSVAPADPILGTTLAWRADPHPQKMNLGVGAYRTEEGKPYVFSIVKKVERQIIEDSTMDKEYLPIEGLAAFNTGTAKLIFGEDSPALAEKRVATVQSISGTGSLRVGFEFIAKYLPGSTIYVSNPTWGNHLSIMEKAQLKYVEYPYLEGQTCTLAFDKMMSVLSTAAAGSVVLLHACAHNPTGVDPSQPQWEAIANLMQERGLIPYFDCAYQGFASGDLHRDAWAVRMFVARGFEMFVSQSYAKNFGLYGERIGALNIVCKTAAQAEAVLSQVKLVIRPMYSNPPVHGARIVAKVLSNPEYFNEWATELKAVSERILSMRQALVDALQRLQTPGTWTHITSQIGMFSYTGLSPAQVEVLIKKYHIYLLKSGRISMAGINTRNVEYLATAIHDAVTSA